MPSVTVSGSGQTYTFNYYERYGSPVETCSGDTFRAKRIFDVSYDYRWIFIRYMLGTAELKDAGKSIARWLPDQYYVYYAPAFKNQKAFMVATTLEDMEVLGEQRVIDDAFTGSLLKTSAYKVARITIGYEAVTYDVKTDTEMGGESEWNLKRFVTVFRQPTAEFLTLPHGAFKWVEFDGGLGGDETRPLFRSGGTMSSGSDSNGNTWATVKGVPAGLPVTGSNGKIISAQEVILIHHKVPGIPKALNTHIGCVNDAEWPALRAQRGQLLLSNVELKPYRWLDNQRLYDITYKFKFFDPDPKKTEEMVKMGKPNRARGHNWFMQHFPNTAATTATDALNSEPSYKLITHNGFADDFQAAPGRTVYRYANMKELFGNYQILTEGQY